MLRKTYDFVIRKANSPHAEKWLATISFIESSFFPIPPDIMLIPMLIAQPRRALWIASICTLASVIGGVFGYLIGMFLFDAIGSTILALYGLEEKFDLVKDWFIEYGAAILIIKGMTPIPYKILTITAGVVGLNIWIFLGASIICRGIRFYLVATLIYFYGESIRSFIERRLVLVTTIAAVLAVAGFVAIKWLHP
jgi:membrane protein YqaA with SNARE-associated domain